MIKLLCTFLGSFYMCGCLSVVVEAWKCHCVRTFLLQLLEILWNFLWCVVGVLSIACLLGVVLPGINVHVSTFFSLPCMDWFHNRAGVFSMSGHVIVSFPCRNCFPRKAGVFSMPGGNSAWLKLEVLIWRCCHCILPVF